MAQSLNGCFFFTNATNTTVAAGLAARYHEMEAEVFNALLTLISDTAVLRDYQAAALAIVQVSKLASSSW